MRSCAFMICPPPVSRAPNTPRTAYKVFMGVDVTGAMRDDLDYKGGVCGYSALPPNRARSCYPFDCGSARAF